MTAFQQYLRRAGGAVLLAATLVPATASAASDATGVWLNDTGRGAIEIKPCGAALCGHVVWVKDGSDAKGCGRQIIGDARKVSGSVWDNGWIYSPERKKRYDVELKPLDGERLRVTGYAGSKFFSKTMIWKRAPADLQRCGTVEAKAAAPQTATAAPAPAATEAAIPAPTANSTLPAPVEAAANPAPAAAPATAAAAATPESRSPETRLRDQLNAPAKEQATGETPAEDDTGESETAEAGGLDMGKLKLDKYLKRRDGKCDLDLPWVKVSFACDK
jgi:uncharacterized protein (DUF2147 family)